MHESIRRDHAICRILWRQPREHLRLRELCVLTILISTGGKIDIENMICSVSEAIGGPNFVPSKPIL